MYAGAAQPSESGQMNIHHRLWTPIWREYDVPGCELTPICEPAPVYPPLCPVCGEKMVPDRRKKTQSEHRCKPCKTTCRRLAGDPEFTEPQEVQT